METETGCRKRKLGDTALLLHNELKEETGQKGQFSFEYPCFLFPLVTAKHSFAFLSYELFFCQDKNIL